MGKPWNFDDVSVFEGLSDIVKIGQGGAEAPTFCFSYKVGGIFVQALS